VAPLPEKGEERPLSSIFERASARDAPNPRKPAVSKFNALMKSCADQQVRINAAKRPETDEARTREQRDDPRAMTWLNQQPQQKALENDTFPRACCLVAGTCNHLKLLFRAVA
jgi:hypothetical protein